MTKKKVPKTSEKPEVKEKGYDYAQFTLMLSKLCITFSIKLFKLLSTIMLRLYRRIQIYRAYRQLKKDVRECAKCREYFEDVDPYDPVYIYIKKT